LDAYDERGLSFITDLIHDEEIALGDVTFDEVDRVLTVPVSVADLSSGRTLWRLLSLRKVSVPVKRWLLRIHGVENSSLTATPGLKSYCFRAFAFDERNRMLRLQMYEPCHFEVRVSELHVSMEPTQDIVSEFSVCLLGSYWLTRRRW
jgi:hypothetical protein